MGPKFQFLKVFPTIFSFTNHVSQHFTLIEAKKWTNIFSNQFFKRLLSPRGPKFQFLKKVFPTIFFSLTKHVSHHFTLIEAKKWTNIFSNQFFKIFFKLLSPYGTKISIFEKSVSDDFFIHKPCFTTFHVDRSQKMDKHFQNFLQVIVPLCDQKFNF